MYRALYRKWRPRTFDDVSGQEQVTDILKYQVAEGRISHAYLFCGSRGTGKTSCAKILAKAVNCPHTVNGNPCNECEICRSIDAGTAPDVIEMDAASNNGVDNVRDMKDEIVFTPAELKYRVYIIDEVHMMSGSAFNALLKTLEEPPSYVLFILATTELNKLPATIISRCQRYDFRRITTECLIARLRQISAAEGIVLEESGARLIARMAQGGMRDAVSLLELCAGMNEPVTETLAARVLGIGSRDTPGQLVDAVLAKDYPTIYKLVGGIISSSEDLAVFWQELIDYYRDLIVVKTLGDAKEYLDLTDGEQQSLSDRATRIPMAKLLYHSTLLENALEPIRRSGAGKRGIAELTLTRMCEPKLTVSPEAMLARIDDLERKLASLQVGAPIAEPPAAASTPRLDEKPENKPFEKPELPKEEGKATENQSLSGWTAVLEEFAELKPSLRPFLKGSTAELASDGTVSVNLTVSIFTRMLEADTEAQKILVNLLNRHGEKASAIRFRSAPVKENKAQIEF